MKRKLKALQRKADVLEARLTIALKQGRLDEAMQLTDRIMSIGDEMIAEIILSSLERKVRNCYEPQQVVRGKISR